MRQQLALILLGVASFGFLLLAAERIADPLHEVEQAGTYCVERWDQRPEHQPEVQCPAKLPRRSWPRIVSFSLTPEARP